MSSHSFNNLPVDAGNISVLLKSKIKYKKNNLSKTVQIKKGLYNIEISCKDSWNGSVKIKGFIKVENDEDTLIVGDACYSIKDSDWGNFLDKTDYLGNMHSFGVSLNTGGDGTFNIKVSITKAKKDPGNLYEKAVKKAKTFLEKNLQSISSLEELKEFKELFIKKFLEKGPLAVGSREDLLLEIDYKGHEFFKKELEMLKNRY